MLDISAVTIAVSNSLFVIEFVIIWSIAEIVSFVIFVGLFVVGTNPNWNINKNVEPFCFVQNEVGLYWNFLLIRYFCLLHCLHN